MITLCMYGSPIIRVESTKFLGVFIDEKLTWKTHINHIKLKVSRGLGVMSRVRNILSSIILIKLYHTLIYPHFVYCIIAWGSAKPTLLNKLFILQKRAVRLCTGSGFRTSSNPLFTKLHLLKIGDIYNLYTTMFMFQLKCNTLPNSCLNLVSLANKDNVYNTRYSGYFKIENFRTRAREMYLAVRGPKLWDSLPLQIQTSANIGLFKKATVGYYLSCY